jgi:PAT family beta-lactamase induction signal transducer AmpG
MLTGNGLIVIIGGYLEQEYGDKESMVLHHDYCRSYYGCLNHLQFFLHLEQKRQNRGEKSLEPKVSFGAVFASFFKKNKLGSYWPLLFPWANQLLKMLTPFLIDDISVGGMGLTTQDVGIIYGTFRYLP